MSQEVPTFGTGDCLSLSQMIDDEVRMRLSKVATLVPLAMLLGCTTAGHVQAPRLNPEQQEIWQLQRAWVEAAVAGNADRFGAFMDDDYRVISRGRVRDKVSWVESIRSGQATYESVVYHNVSVDLYGDTAVISGQYSQAATREGQDNSGRGVFVAAWVKKAGQWRAVGSIYP